MFCDTNRSHMFTPKLCVSKLLLAFLVVPSVPKAWGSAYDAHPKLVVVLVVDQLRADALDRYRADFKGRGFRLFLDKGAYFEDCYYNYANTKTAPGHATLGTGAYTDGHGISANAWWDLTRNKTRPVTAVEDDRYRILGAIHPGKEPGASPLNLRASTVGDSLRLATAGQAKVFGISLKDRAAILPAGYSANGAYWIEPASGAFITSSYYMDALPDWVTAFNSGDRAGQAAQEAGAPDTKQFYETVGGTPAGNAYEFDFARALITGSQAARSWYMAAWQLPWLPERVLGRCGGRAFRDILVRTGLDPASADRYAALPLVYWLSLRHYRRIDQALVRSAGQSQLA